MNRLRILFVALGVVLALASVYLSFQLLNPTPPKVVRLATGPDGSAYYRLGELYRRILADNGVEVILVPSGGALENLEILGEGAADLGFLHMGTPDTQGAGQLRSLGAMFFEPLWLFTRNPELAQGQVAGLTPGQMSIGPPKSRSNSASRYLLELNGIDADQLNLLELAPSAASSALERGDLESLFIVGNAISPVIKQLLANPDVSLADFERADAYAALFPELTKLVVPAGVGNLALDLPARDTRVLAFTAILAVDSGLHPITQSLFLEAASRIHSSPDIFHGAGEFPQPVDQALLLSDSARAYYADGRPLLLRLLPYWIAVIVMQLLAAAIPLLGLVYPLVKLMPSAFHWAIRRRFHLAYNELRSIDRSIGSASAEQLDAHLRRLEEMEQRATSLRVPVTYATMVYGLKAHIGSVLQRVRAAIESLGNESS